MPEVPHHVPLKPGDAINIGPIGVLRRTALSKDAVRVIAKQIPRQMTRIIPMHLISLERDKVISRVLQRPRACFLSNFGYGRSGIIIDAGGSRFSIPNRPAATFTEH